jgi:hypothetical protein
MSYIKHPSNDVIINDVNISDVAFMLTSDIISLVIAFLICMDCAKEPEYRCENCDKVYKQEARYNSHIVGCVAKNTLFSGVGSAPVLVSSDDNLSELLRQNREMLELLRKQQETIHLLVAQMTSGVAVAK